MSDQKESRVSRELVQQLAEHVLRGFVEDGTIDIQDKTPAEIVAEYQSIIDASATGSGRELRSIVDYRKNLLNRAAAEVNIEQYWMAVILYATWFEHEINATLTRAFERKDYDANVIAPLLRELRPRTKASALWSVAGLPPIKDEDLTLLDQIVQFRNAFVHYKWVAYDERADDQRNRQLKDIVEKAPGLVSSLANIQTEAFWNNRDTEIMKFLRATIAERWREEGPFNPEVPPEAIDD
jgi:hypothetical protein